MVKRNDRMSPLLNGSRLSRRKKNRNQSGLACAREAKIAVLPQPGSPSIRISLQLGSATAAPIQLTSQSRLTNAEFAVYVAISSLANRSLPTIRFLQFNSSEKPNGRVRQEVGNS